MNYGVHSLSGNQDSLRNCYGRVCEFGKHSPTAGGGGGITKKLETLHFMREAVEWEKSPLIKQKSCGISLPFGCRTN